MPDRTQACAEHVRAILKKAQMPRNQIASFSGLSNTYIRDLEAGNYASVRREKLISLAVAVNLNLPETDDLLEVFDRTPLTEDDIPTFLSMPRRRKGSAALLPLRDGFPLELALLSAETQPGPQVVVNPQPTFSLFDEGHRRYIERQNMADHPIYGELVEAIAKERRMALDRNLENHRVEQYICRDCLEDYFQGLRDEQERGWRIRHLNNVIYNVRERDNFRFHVLGICPTTSFTLKQFAQEKEKSERLFLSFWPRHHVWRKRIGRLSGFTTDNPVVIRNFKEEVESLSRVAVEEFKEKKNLLAYLSGLIG